MNLNSNYNQIPILNSIRAFAAISVCFYHFICTTTGFISDTLLLDMFSFGKYGVQLFFVISGFVIPWSMYFGGYKLQFLPKFILKRLIRLEPPYLISILLAIIIISLRKIILKNNDLDFNFNQIALHIGYFIPFFEKYNWINQVYWTLAIEFQYYLLIAMFFMLIISENKYYRFISYSILLLSGLIKQSNFLPYWLPVFLLGILVFQYKINKINKNDFFTMVLITYAFLFFNHSFGEIIYSAIGVISILFFGNKNFKIGNFFGEISYSIYLTHTIIGASVINILSHNATNSFEKTIIIVLGFVITITFSLIIHKWIEKPSKKFSNKLKYGI